jgi:tetratricopeptide (TPR) repeat protein
VHTYATELITAHEPDREITAARRRLLDHYLHTARTGAVLLDPARTDPDGPAGEPSAPGVTVEPLADIDSALAWFSRERPALLGVLAAATDRFDRHVCRLAWALKPFLHRGHLRDAVTAEQARLDAALRLDDEPEQLLAHCNLSRAHTLLRRLDRAFNHARRALDLAVRLDDAIGRAHAHHEFTWMLGRAGRWPEASRHAEAALDLYRASGEPSLHARALNGVAYCLAALGHDPDRARQLCEQALAIFHETGDPHSEAYSWDGCGLAYSALGRPDEAARCHRQAVHLHQQTGDAFAAAEALGRLGVAYQAADRHHAAHRAWTEALTIFERYEHPDAARIRQRLRSDRHNHATADV